ncbi:MAG: flagellar motor switch protein FliN [Gallionella sp.]|jgi:flagellar motor switch protein FliN/FliY
MSEETAITADDWGAAMSEQSAADAGTDDWAAAMAEQETSTSQPAGKAHVFEKFGATGGASTQNDLDMILDIPVQLTVELGRTKMPIKNLLQLAQGSVVELAGMAGEPLDVMINGFLIAQGEVVVVNDKLGIRLTDITTPSERLRRINR